MQLYINETTAPIQNYTFTFQNESVAVTAEQIEIHTTMALSEIKSLLKLGKLNYFSISAVNRIGIGEASHSSIESKTIYSYCISCLN